MFWGIVGNAGSGVRISESAVDDFLHPKRLTANSEIRTPAPSGTYGVSRAWNKLGGPPLSGTRNSECEPGASV